MVSQDGKLAFWEVALSHPWSNGVTDGLVDRLGLGTRKMYGPANFDLLRRRYLGNACGFLKQKKALLGAFFE